MTASIHETSARQWNTAIAWIKPSYSPCVSCLAYVLFLGCLHFTTYGSIFKHRIQMGEEIIPPRGYMFVYIFSYVQCKWGG